MWETPIALRGGDKLVKIVKLAQNRKATGKDK